MNRRSFLGLLGLGIASATVVKALDIEKREFASDIICKPVLHKQGFTLSEWEADIALGLKKDVRARMNALTKAMLVKS